MPQQMRSLLLAVAFIVMPSPGRAADDPKVVEFFENKIRPALIEHCQKCHSEEAAKANKLRGGLLLDTAAGWRKGGDTGPAIVPGKPAEGTLIESLKYNSDTKMPPKGKLPDAVIADFEKWVKDGAIDPRGASTAVKPGNTIDLELGRAFWSFQPPHEHPAPVVSIPGFAPRTDIDRFVAAKWAEKGLTPVGVADKRTLIRRVTFDLIGLPPTPEEVAAFLADESPEAFGRLVDRLLTSPHYGERWARHWLDVARYAEDQAHTFAVTPKKNAYVYRDWVIKAFNDDMPYDQFVKFQLAGDLMPEASGDLFTRIAGLGFLGLGAEYYKNTAAEQAIADELDDRVDTVTRGFLGLTVSCARCHDHKFDPIPTRDYYSIAGIFNGTKFTQTVLSGPDEQKRFNDSQARIKDQEKAADRLISEAGKSAQKTALAKTSRYLIAARAVRSAPKTNTAELAKKEELNPYLLERWVKFLDPKTVAAAPPLLKDLNLKPDSSNEEFKAVAETVEKGLLKLPVHHAPPAKDGKPVGKTDPLTRAMFLETSAPLMLPPAEVEKHFLTPEQKAELERHRAELEKCKKEAPPAPLSAHVLSGNGMGMKVYIRGNPATKGEDAPKGFVRVIATAQPNKDYTRLNLAEAIANPANPLTARVIVNRVWYAHFGRGLVNTPSNFGKLGEPPSHPELLDHLAVGFMKNGWSIKWLHRQILRSQVYQLASTANPANAGRDGGNVYLWHAARRRLDVETWRDSLLAVSGTLDETMGGPTYELRDPSARRRTVYAKISRHELDGLLRLFDFPDANVTADRRTSTTVPQQQLFALNSEFMTARAKALAARVEPLGSTDPGRITAAYRLLFARTPTPEELALATRFLALPVHPEDKMTRWQQLAQALLASNEFLYAD